MSTSLSSEELPEKLDKLEISRTLPQVKLMDSDLPLTQNPFYDDGSSNSGGGSEFQLLQNAAYAAATHIFPPTTTTPITTTAAQQCHTIPRPQTCRRCRFRRRSESVLDEYKASVASAADVSEAARSTPGVQRQPLKKTSASGGVNRKILIREPILRALQSCFYPHNVRRKLAMPAEATEIARRPEAPTIVDGKCLIEAATAQSSNASSPSSRAAAAAANRGISDFRDLISECQILLEQDVDFSGRLNQLSLSHRNSKNFTTMQHIPSTSTAAAAANKSRNQQQQGRVSLEDSNGLLISPPPNSITTRSSSSPSPEHNAAARGSSSTSCSQQAGNGATSSAAATNSDDVNIDELASYFDTFVHIPKKMSSMAEMMYI